MSEQRRRREPAGTSPETAPGRPWHSLSCAEVLDALGGDAARGLSQEEAERRLEQIGPNELTARAGRGPVRIFFQQFLSLMVLLLIGAAAVSGLVLEEWQDALVILVIVVLNAVLGFWQEFRAERALEALKRLSRPGARVRRDGRVGDVPAERLVPGDVVLVEAGALIPADARILESANLKVQESALTGEAEAVEKSTEPLSGEEIPLGDRRNMLYMGTVATFGRAAAVVTATGMSTELGRIAGMLEQTGQEPTLLQRKLRQLSVVLVFGALGLIAVVALEGWLLRGLGMKELFLTAVSMAVAAIPEGLPAVVTIALALGAQRMLRRRALIRRLPAVETLGSVTVICTDKTGTLTQNRMTVTVLDLADGRVELPGGEGEGAGAAGLAGEEAAWLLLAGGALASDAVLAADGEGEGRLATLGDPTEGALVAAAARCGLPKPSLEEGLPRVAELPFDSERKRMTTVHAPAAGENGLPPGVRRWLEREGAGRLAFTKGAVDGLLEVSTALWRSGGPQPLTEELRRRLRERNEALAAEGIRVLGVCVRALGSPRADEPGAGEAGDRAAGDPQELERGLVFVGMQGMLDPLRPEVREAVATCRQAGIRPVMITGDHPLIARTIARELELEHADRVLTGAELSRLGPQELAREVEGVSVFARVAPEHKLKIVDALQERGQIVAMTGDGVNDAPALKSADIGVAMGMGGTDVSKEASDMVLQDDNFATIVAAVEEGRIIFDNILRFVRYIISSNSAEILVMLAAPLFGLPLPLYPVQILWMNLVTDGLPALALGVEPGEPEVMRRPPRRPDTPILSGPTGIHVLWVGLLMATLALTAGLVPYYLPGRLPAWRTMLFSTLVFSQLTLAVAERSSVQSLRRLGLFSNPAMVWAMAATFSMQLAVIYVPLLQRFFRTTALTATELGISVLLSLAMVAALEVQKALKRRRRP